MEEEIQRYLYYGPHQSMMAHIPFLREETSSGGANLLGG